LIRQRYFGREIGTFPLREGKENWAALGGLDTLVFAAGIGGNAPDGPRQDLGLVEGRIMRTDKERMFAGTVCSVFGLGHQKENGS